MKMIIPINYLTKKTIQDDEDGDDNEEEGLGKFLKICLTICLPA